MLNRRKTNGILSSTAIATRKQGQDNQLSLWIMYKYAPCLQEFDLSSFENSLSYVKTCENQGSKNLKNQQNLHSSTAPQLHSSALLRDTPRHLAQHRSSKRRTAAQCYTLSHHLHRSRIIQIYLCSFTASICPCLHYV